MLKRITNILCFIEFWSKAPKQLLRQITFQLVSKNTYPFRKIEKHLLNVLSAYCKINKERVPIVNTER